MKGLDEHCEKQKRELVSRYVLRTFYHLPPQELLKALRQKRRPVKRRRQARGGVNPGRSVECVEETGID